MLDLNPETDVVYICGNPNMIDQSFEMLTNAGFDIKSVRREKYISSNQIRIRLAGLANINYNILAILLIRKIKRYGT